MSDSVGLARLFAFIFGFSGLLFIIVATPTHHWFVYKMKNNDTIYGGIWENCRQDTDGMYSCSNLQTTDWLNAVKAFLIIAIILYLFVVLYLIMMVWGKGMTVRFIGIDLLFAAMFGVIAMSVYTGKYHLKPGYEYGWSYVLGWSGSIATVVSGVLCFFADVDYEPVR
ncbi:peripheral myelin protein 22-like [Rhopilema esculentum]|uniref:peripheral myelin protein 22-like n=1 Tax=Rhopilema esculentum TaxID=499914 RepID=UPI0031DB6A17